MADTESNRKLRNSLEHMVTFFFKKKLSEQNIDSIDTKKN